MLVRLVLWGLRRYIGGPAKSWVFTTAAMFLWRLVRTNTGRQELIDLSSTKPGDVLLIEHLPISHKRQIKDIRKEKRQDRKLRRATRKASR